MVLQQYNENTQWVVKSSSQILGPFTTQEVFELIKKRYIIPIDEIIPEGGYWAYVRDVELFQGALSEQAQTAGVEVTKTQNVTSTFTDDMTSTELLDDTEELSQIGHVDRTNPNPKIQPIRSDRLPRPSAENFIITKTKSQPPAKKRTPSNFKIKFLFLLLIISVGTGYYYQDWIQSQIMKYNSPQVIQTAQESLEQGDYQTAYQKFQEMNQLEGVKTNVKGFYVQLAALVLNQERQTVYARELLEKADANLRNTPEWLTVMGLSYLIDQNYSESHKYLNQSVTLNPDFLPAWVNLGYLNLNQGKFQEAWTFFYAAYLRGYTEGHIVALMAQSLIEQWRVNRDARLLLKSHDLVNNFLSTSADRRYLNQILQIWLDLKGVARNQNVINEDILKFIESDPYVATKFKQNIYELSFDTKKFEGYCGDIQRALNPNDLNTLLFKSVCHFQLGYLTSIAEATIAKAEELYPKDALMFAVKSIILGHADETYQKSLLIGRALSSDTDSKYVLPLILQARFCEQKNDFNCMAKYWDQVYEKNRLEIGLYSGLATYFKHKQDGPAFKKWVADGRLLSPSYKPLIKLDY